MSADRNPSAESAVSLVLRHAHELDDIERWIEVARSAGFTSDAWVSSDMSGLTVSETLWGMASPRKPE